jgi:hypothetical protein
MASSPTLVQTVAAALFALALVHTFSTKLFERLAQRQPRHAGLWHLLGEVEVVFGFWAMVLVLAIFAIEGGPRAVQYLEARNFTEPLFVFTIMVVAATKPVLQLAGRLVRGAVRLLPLAPGVGTALLLLSVVPLLGSLITEPAAMTLAALMLRDSLFAAPGVSTRAKYGALGVLFVNVSIGGVLTPYAAPPVLMVAATWNWDLAFMLKTFGWKAAAAVFINAAAFTLLFRRELALAPGAPAEDDAVPLAVVLVHLLFLAGVVLFGHHPVLFLGLFLFFVGFTHAYQRHQSPLILREALLVAFFLAGLVVLGGLQQWWLQPLLLGMDAQAVFFGATALTAITDNAALTYLGSLVPGLSDAFKVALVAGAVTGGGLTIIANAPNPAGAAILKSRFADATIHPLGLLAAAALPTLVAGLLFNL